MRGVRVVLTMLGLARPGMRRLGGLCVLAAVAAGLGGCSMADSALLGDVSKLGCSSSAGNYYLSRSFLEVQVATTQTGKKELAGVYVKPKADRERGYCLDYLASATSADTFVVQKDDAELLLNKITSNAEDQSKVIAQTIVQAVFVALSGNPDFPDAATVGDNQRAFTVNAIPDTSTRAFGAEFDPFNEAQAALVNDGLKDHGFCLVLEGQTFGGGVRDINDYCNRPLQRHKREAALASASTFAGSGKFAPYSRGVLYRPRLPYNLFLFANTRPGQKLPGKWVLRQTATVYLENQSPTFAIGIDRAFFAARKTTLTFNMGVLQDVAIEKTSELAGFVEVPLQIVNSLAALPAQIIQVKIDQTSRRQALIAAQDALITQQLAYNKDVAAYEALKKSNKATTGSPANQSLPKESGASSQCLSECAKEGIPPETCSIRCK